jgi:hypothetical protein
MDDRWKQALGMYIEAVVMVHVTLKAIQAVAHAHAIGRETVLGGRVAEQARAQAWRQARGLQAAHSGLLRALEDRGMTYEQALEMTGYGREDFEHFSPTVVRPLLEARSHDELLEIVVGRVL